LVFKIQIQHFQKILDPDYVAQRDACLQNSVVDPDLDPLDPELFGHSGSGSVIFCTDPDPDLDPHQNSSNIKQKK
jgi:hypothetical protein